MPVLAVDVAVRNLFRGGGAHIGDGTREQQCNAGQRVVAIDHDLLVGDVGDGEQAIVAIAILGATLELHAHLDVVGEQLARLDGYQFGVITGTPQEPAFFRQKREGLDEFIEGESELIEYDGRADTVKFIRKAVLRRLRGATLADEITGGLIVYENLTERFSVDGNAVPGSASGPGNRVRAMLTPKPSASAPAPQGKTPADSAAPGLRATTTLGSAPR